MASAQSSGVGRISAAPSAIFIITAPADTISPKAAEGARPPPEFSSLRVLFYTLGGTDELFETIN